MPITVCVWNLQKLALSSNRDMGVAVQALHRLANGHEVDIFLFSELSSLGEDTIEVLVDGGQARGTDVHGLNYYSGGPWTGRALKSGSPEEMFGFLYRNLAAGTDPSLENPMLPSGRGSVGHGRQILGGRRAGYIQIGGYNVYVVHPSPNHLTATTLSDLQAWVQLSGQSQVIIGGDFNTPAPPLLPGIAFPEVPTHGTVEDAIDGFLFSSSDLALDGEATAPARLLRSWRSITDHKPVWAKFLP